MDTSRITFQEGKGPKITAQTHQVAEIEFMKDIKDIKYAQGIALADDKDLRTAKTAGWIFGLPFVWKQIKFEDVSLTVQTSDQLEKTLKKFVIGLLLKHAKTAVPKKLHETDDGDLLKSAKGVITKLMGNIEKTKVDGCMETLENDGYVVCDFNYDLLVSEQTIVRNHQKALNYIKSCGDTHSIGIPIIFTPMAI